MKKYLLSLFVIFTSINCFSQDLTRLYYVQTSQTGERFEIIQSPISRKITLKLDKFTGLVYQLVQGSDDVVAWDRIPQDKKSIDNTQTNRINYQIFCGGISLKDVILLNLHTGETWMLMLDKDNNYAFVKIF